MYIENIKMESNVGLKEIGVQSCLHYYSEDIIKIKDLILIIFYWMKIHTEIFSFITFDTKLSLV